MTIPYHILIGDPLSKEEEIEALIFRTFQEVDAHFNNWNPHSEISLLNQLPAQEKKPVSPFLLPLLYLAGDVYRLTEGRFDPTVERLQQLWKKRLKYGVLPSEEELAPLENTIGWDKIHIENGLFWKEHSLIAIDLGGISKGYTVDLFAERLMQMGLKNFFIEWGGEIRASGSHPEGRPWKIDVSYVSVIEMNDGAIATSGDRFQQWEIQEETFFHILDPRNKQPLKKRSGSIASVSIKLPSCALADGLATALMLFPNADEAEAWILRLVEKKLPREDVKEMQCWILENQ